MNNHHVAGGTDVYTKEGRVSIRTLVDKEVELWNGCEFVTGKVESTLGVPLKYINIKGYSESGGLVDEWYDFDFICCENTRSPIQKKVFKVDYTSIETLWGVKLNTKLQNTHTPDGEKFTLTIYRHTWRQGYYANSDTLKIASYSFITPHDTCIVMDGVLVKV
jgi:hypothetical protein